MKTNKTKAIDSAIASAAQENSAREKLLVATLELLAGGCLHTISIRDIAQAANVNSALVSYYFGSKEQLYLAIVQFQFEAYRKEVVQHFVATGDARENLKAACTAIADFHRRHPHFLLLYFRELTNPSPAYEQVILPCIAEASEKACAMVQTGIDQKIFKSDTKPRYVVQSLISMINYSFMTSRLHRDLNISPVNELNEYLDYTLELILHRISS